MIGTTTRLLLLVASGWIHSTAHAASPPLWYDLDETYTFPAFLRDFGKRYDDADEYKRRQSIFQENLRGILRHNSGVFRASQTGVAGSKAVHHQGYVLGINQFADSHPEEIPTGLAKTPRYYSSMDSSRISTSSTRKLHGDVKAFLPYALDDPISELPKEIDWRTKGVVTPVKSQGRCGSCWAFASTAVLESHLAINTGKLFELSEQQLVSCAPNPRHCGGLGGCAGSVATIAYEHIRDHGMVQEWEFGYQSNDGKEIPCSLKNKTSTTLESSSVRGRPQSSGAYYQQAVVSLAGYVELEKNNYLALMNAVARMGPVAVSVTAIPWRFYAGGVFSMPFNTSDTKSTDVNHLVVLDGYGTDPVTKEDYWLVRNSWSPVSQH